MIRKKALLPASNATVGERFFSPRRYHGKSVYCGMRAGLAILFVQRRVMRKISRRIWTAVLLVLWLAASGAGCRSRHDEPSANAAGPATTSPAPAADREIWEVAEMAKARALSEGLSQAENIKCQPPDP